MHAFQKAYLDADGNLAWSYNKTTTDSTSLGIVPEDLPGYDAMSGQDWRLFKSSNSSIVSAENLKSRSRSTTRGCRFLAPDE